MMRLVFSAHRRRGAGQSESASHAVVLVGRPIVLVSLPLWIVAFLVVAWLLKWPDNPLTM